jgi:hypothetical protein
MRLAPEVRAFRARSNHQANLFLLVMTDGDRLGVLKRKSSFDAQLKAEGLRERSAQEKIVYLVPTWSIETWLIWLCNQEGRFPEFGEANAYRDHSTYTALCGRDGITSKLASANWPEVRTLELPTVPSLSDARLELKRIP